MSRLILLVLSSLFGVNGHGRLVEPPSRASAWRYGWSSPVNYDDNALFCGGFQRQWQINGGKCGVCGDPWDRPREHEAGGRYATGRVFQRYGKGQVINVEVELTANHKGWFEFRICPTNDPKRRATQPCLDRFLLPLANRGSSRLPITSDMRTVNVQLRLPRGLTCSHCVLQWKYNTGNSWGTDPRTGESCVGCGPQEQFYGCADVAIDGGQGNPDTPSPQAPLQKFSKPSSGRNFHRPVSNVFHQPRGYSAFKLQQEAFSPKPTAENKFKCSSIGTWQNIDGMNRWCTNNCRLGFCPSTYCLCSN